MEQKRVTKKKRRSGGTTKSASSRRTTRTSRRAKRLNPITRLSWPGDDIGQGLSNRSDVNSSRRHSDSLLVKKQLSQSFSFSPTNTPSYLLSESNNGNKRLKAIPKRQQNGSSLSSSVSTSTYSSNHAKNVMDRTSEDNQLWVDKYRPTNIKDLCVAPKKISEVREWLEKFNSNNNNNHINSQYHGSDHKNSSKLLILVGSGGIGKSTLIHVLAKELHWKISKWNELHNVKISSPLSSSNFISPESQLSSFEEFLSSSALGCNITLVNDGDNNNNDSDGYAKCNYGRSLVLIDEIPNLHNIQNEARFRQIMSQYIQKAQIPTVLIYSDVYEGRYKPEELEKIIDPIILSSQMMTKIIQMNPVTKSKMNQCISRIIKGEYDSQHIHEKKYSKRNRKRINSGHGMNISSELLEEIHTQSGGDLRHAIMTLQFQFCGNITGSVNNINSLGGPPTTTAITAQRDVRLSTFHALGKLMYAKRVSSRTDSIIMPTESISSFHNCAWNKDRRPPLEFQPERVLEDSTIGLNGAIHFIGYHSPEFFTDITELSTAFSRFSDAALFLDKSYGTINDNSYPYGYTTSIISRSVADANKHPMPSKFRQFHAPKVYEVVRKKRENQSKIQHLCKKLSNKLDYLELGSSIWESSSFSLEHYPFLKKIIPDEVSSLSTNLYSNDCFVVNKEYDRSSNPANNLENKTFEKKIQEQRQLLLLDDIEDSSSDEYEVQDSKNCGKNLTDCNDNAVSFGKQDKAKSEIIVVDDE